MVPVNKQGSAGLCVEASDGKSEWRAWGVIVFSGVTATASLGQVTFTTLVNFSGTNGNYPSMVLTQGADGNFYGTNAMGWG